MFESAGIPTVLFCSTTFLGLASDLKTMNGHPELPVVVVPHPFGTASAETVRQTAAVSVDHVVGALTGGS